MRKKNKGGKLKVIKIVKKIRREPEGKEWERVSEINYKYNRGMHLRR